MVSSVQKTADLQEGNEQVGTISAAPTINFYAMPNQKNPDLHDYLGQTRAGRNKFHSYQGVVLTKFRVREP